MMKILTVRQPWASCIVAGIKTIENRGKSTSYRGDVAILAGKSLDGDARAMHAFERLCAFNGMKELKDLPQGVIIGLVELYGVTNHRDDWWFTGPFGWTLQSARPLTTHYPYRGQLGLVNCPADFEQTIRRSL